MSGHAPGPFTVIAIGVHGAIEWMRGPPHPPKPPKPPRPRCPPLSPPQINTRRACLAAGLLASCIYAPFFTKGLLGRSVGSVIAEFAHDPGNPPAALVMWTSGIVIAAVYLAVGLRGASEGPHGSLWAFWSVALPVVGGVLIWRHASGLLGNPVAGGICLLVTVVCAMRCWLAMRESAAVRTIAQSIALKNAPLRSARGRPWWKFW